MVSFSCEPDITIQHATSPSELKQRYFKDIPLTCGDVLTKKKLDPHRNRCRGATFTCIDCMVHFPGFEYRSHTSCMTEDQKYQGALYKGKPKKQEQQSQQEPQQPKPSQQHQQPKQAPKQTSKLQQEQEQEAEQRPAEKRQKTEQKPAMALAYSLQPFVEDIGDDQEYESWHEYEARTDDERSPAEYLPEAPTPPSAHDDNVNVFDFLVAANQTPNASAVNLLPDQKIPEENTSLVRYEPKSEEIEDPSCLMDEDGEPLVEVRKEILATPQLVTPAPKTERRKSKDGEVKKDKKRKRLHVDVPTDQVMTDAPPVLHSGLTGGLKSLMRPTFPPSPDYSGDNNAEGSPASPLKKTKHSKHKSSHVTHSLFGMISGPPKSKSKSKKPKTSKKHSSRSKEEKKPKLIEFRPSSKDGKDANANNQMVVFKPRADVFLSFVNKGPESDRGCSMNKALKRFHRERQAAGSSMAKVKEEKELWRSLRLRRNDRGEIVLFSEDGDL